MSTALEVVMPDVEGRRLLSKGLPAEARVVSTPSQRSNVGRIVVATLHGLETLSGVDVLARIREEQPDVPVILCEIGSGKSSGVHLRVLQHVAIASEPADPAFVAPDKETVARIVRAHLAGAEKKLIASAQIEDGHLSVWSCEPKLYRCEVSSLAPLRKMPAASLRRFEVSKSGSRLHWPDADVDLTLESIQSVADPAIRAAQERHYRVAAKSYAKAIRLLREQHGLAQSAIEGLSDRAVRRIEQGERIPHSSTLEKLAKAHGMTMDQYMAELGRLSSGNGPRIRR